MGIGQRRLALQHNKQNGSNRSRHKNHFCVSSFKNHNVDLSNLDSNSITGTYGIFILAISGSQYLGWAVQLSNTIS
jgi:hypothetical protein